MRSVEWNKKEELVAEQAMKYLKVLHGMQYLLDHLNDDYSETSE